LIETEKWAINIFFLNSTASSPSQIFIARYNLPPSFSLHSSGKDVLP